MKRGLAAAVVLLILSGCTSTYPYLITTDNCNCERFVYKGAHGSFELEVSAQYVVSDRVSSEVDLTFHNLGRDTLSLRQAYIKATSANVSYQNNGRFQPMPFVAVPPGESYAMTVGGSDIKESEDPWLKIAGEKVTIELQGVLLGGETIAPIVVTLVPFNPKLDH